MPAVATKRDVSWNKLKKMALSLAEKKGLSDDYLDRLKKEIKEVEKQGAQNRWIGLFNDNYKYKTNENGLVFPWLLKMTSMEAVDRSSEPVASDDLPGAIREILAGDSARSGTLVELDATAVIARQSGR